MTEPLILVAEDNREVRQYLEERVLVPAGYRVRSVGDGMSALTLALELRPAVVISDQQMPNLTGTELTRRLRAEYPVPVILITGESSEGLMLEAIRAGVCDYLTKPFEAEQLLAAVGRALAESQPKAQLM
jgi:CheY-like chemotaxis protein